MKKKVSVLVLVGLVLLLLFAAFGSQAFAKGSWGHRSVPFQATYTTDPKVVDGGVGYIILNIPGVGRGTHLGKSTWLSDDSRVDFGLEEPPEPPFPQVGSMVFTGRNGDEMHGHFFGFAFPNSIGGNYFWGGYEISGGTGRFDGASGSGLYHGRAGEKEGTLYFEGMLMFP